MPTLILLIALHWAPVAPPLDRIAVVVHNGTPAEQMSQDDILRIYLLEQPYWSDGTAVQLHDLRGTQPFKTAFYDALGRQQRNMMRLHMRLVLAGEATAPTKVANTEAMLRSVAETPGAIGYLPADAVDESVTVVAYLPR
ncbi:MAG: hypothetical protein AAGJ10_00045 [Bacteroidota bacterium]